LRISRSCWSFENLNSGFSNIKLRFYPDRQQLGRVARLLNQKLILKKVFQQ
jgi:hypothetical protein